MLELTAQRTAKDLLRECAKRGLVVKLDTVERKRGNARHYHLGFPSMTGVLEITDLGDHTILKVASNRDGGWASALARELADD
jgi:hypothetical protein